MRRLGRYLSVLFLAIALTGCVSNDTSTWGTSATAYSAYSRARGSVTPTTIVAMMSYASSVYSRSDFSNWNEVRSVFNYMALDMESHKSVHPNYPVVPNKAEIALFKQIVNKWVDSMVAARIPIKQGPARFTATAADFIVRISNDEYISPPR